ncbi:MAG: GNAT family N-acetyltransferase [Phycisphaerae bacterium]|nr:GNAT family N-acetyltransferase [Phycisphaerae bacterium]
MTRPTPPDTSARARPARRRPRNPARALRLREGTLDSYHDLAPFHYIANPPGPVELVLVAEDRTGARRDDRLAGVLTLSRPVLNGPWRAVAWPDLAGPDHARDLNASLRTISRLIVEPRWRGMGVGTALVRAALRWCTGRGIGRVEALASMGPVSPVFERAGMRRVTFPCARREARLRATLARLDLMPWDLIDARRVWRDRATGETVERAVRRWANDSRATRAGASDPLGAVCVRAARALCGRAGAYVWEGRARDAG